MTIPGEQTNRLDRLEQDAERQRAELSRTVDDLGEKLSNTVSPSAVKQEVKDYVQRSGEQLVGTLQSKAMDNPLLAVAAAAAVGYPLLRLVASMPVPVLLIGAGLSLSGSGSSGPSSRSTGMQSSLGGRAQAFTSSARDAGAGTAERLTETAEQIQSSITSSAESVAATATEAVRTAGQVFEERREDFLRTLDRNPLLVGGIGLALGALVGAALPRTQAEREAMGDIAEDFQQRARDMAASGVEAAKDAATKVYEEAADEARRQGLSGDQVEAAARRVRDEGEAGFGAGAPSTQNRARKEQ